MIYEIYNFIQKICQLFSGQDTVNSELVADNF